MQTSRVILRSPPMRSAYLRLMLRGLHAKLSNWRRTRQAERELLALDDRLLSDIGISRGDIPHAVRGHDQIYRPRCGLELPQ